MSQIETTRAEIEGYLTRTESKYSVGQDVYYCRLALEQALKASIENNYGIGAVAIVAQGGRVREYHDRSKMFNGGDGIIDHAETRALIASRTRAPDAEYDLSSVEAGDLPKDGLWVFGTLEPCPMCTCALTNAGARRSISLALDGKFGDDANPVSDGAAMVIGKKWNLQPAVWRNIQNDLGLKFELLDETIDPDLSRLAWDIFAVSREDLDNRLSR